MPATREAAVVRAIMAWLKSQPGVLVRKLHGSEFAVAGDPDLYGSWRGKFFTFEVKRPGGPGPTPLQKLRLEEWRKAGAVVGVVRSVDDVRALLEGQAGDDGIIP